VGFRLLPLLAAGLLTGGLLTGVQPLCAQDGAGRPFASGLYAGVSGLFLWPTPDEALLESRGRHDGYGLFVGYRVLERLSLNGEYLWLGRDYRRVQEAPALPNARDNRTRVLTMAFLANARLHQPVGPVSLEVGAGVGWGSSSFFIQAPDGGGFTTDGGPGDEGGRITQLLVALATRVPVVGGLEVGWRRIWLSHDFGVFSGGDTSFGAHALYLAVRAGLLPR
jgi:hypothetical protein